MTKLFCLCLAAFASLTITAAAAVAPKIVLGTFSEASPLRSERKFHTATLLPSGKVLVVGGRTDKGSLGSAELYDPSSDKWCSAGCMATPRDRHTATLLNDGKVLIAGGFNDKEGYLNSAELYDPRSGKWCSLRHSMHKGRFDHTATLLPDGTVLVAGGYTDADVATAELYDPCTERWCSAGCLSTARYLHTATLLPSGDVLITGGYNDDEGFLSSAELYHSGRKSGWTTTGSMKVSRYVHTATLLPNGKVLVAGGDGQVVPTKSEPKSAPVEKVEDSPAVLSSTEIYDPVSGVWTVATPMKAARYAHSATLLPNGKVLVVGGFSDVYLASAEIYDPAAKTWTATGTLTTARSTHTATVLRNTNVLVCGGEDFSGEFSSTALYDAGQATGNYAGLITAQCDTDPSLSTEGYFTATVQATGAFTGKVTIRSTTVAVAGSFDQLGVAHFGATHATTLIIVPPAPGLPSVVLELHGDVAFPAVDATIGGSLSLMFRSSVIGTANLKAERLVYDGRTPDTTVPTNYLAKANADGVYTLILPAVEPKYQPDGFTTADYPQGFGIALVKVSKAGVVTFSGQLADGTATLISMPLIKHGTVGMQDSFPLFAQLYTGKQGFISASVNFDTTSCVSDLSAPDGMEWSRPAANSQYYPDGWPEVIITDLVGAKYTVTAGQSVLAFSLITSTSGPLLPNAALGIYEGALTSDFERGVNISNADVVTKIPATDKTFSMSINRSTGQFSGAFTHTDGTKPAFTGIVYQKGLAAAGYGFFLTTAPKIKTYKGQSGIVVLASGVVIKPDY